MREQTSENRFTHYLIKYQDCFEHNGLGNNTTQIIFLLKESLNVARELVAPHSAISSTL